MKEKLSKNTWHVWMSDNLLRKLEPYCILKGYRGSIAHGTFEESITKDDKDIMGIYIPPEDVTFGIHNMETIERMIEEKHSQKRMSTWDIVYYSLPKYLNLIMKQNPNVISLLWLENEHYIKRTPLGNRLIEARHKLLSKDCYKSYCGYARSQLHRMTHIAPTGRLGKKRKELVAQYGYDIKNAGHLIRLLKMGVETLVTSEVTVMRPDSAMLLEIKRGEWTLEKVIEYAEKLFDLMDEALVKSELPVRVNYNDTNRLCEEIMMEFYNSNRVSNNRHGDK